MTGEVPDHEPRRGLRILKFGLIIGLLITTSIIAGLYWQGFLQPGSDHPCTITRSAAFTLPNAVGRIDHMAYDPNLKRLYVAALENNSLDAINLSSGRMERSLAGFDKPQGVLVVPSANSIFVSNGGTGMVTVLDTSTLRILANISLGSDADNLRYDPTTNLVYVGYGNGAMSSIDPKTYAIRQTVNFSGHPEGFQPSDALGSIFVNIPTSGYIAVVNTSSFSITARWPLTNTSGNFPMSYDETRGRLLVGVRSPSELVVLDSADGRQTSSIRIPEDPDDIFYDPTTSCIYISSGAGYVTMIKETTPNQLSVVGEVATAVGARTSLLTEDSKLFVAEPSSGGVPAQIIEFNVS